MHNTSKILCVGAIVFAFTPAHAEICTDFDDDFNVIEYECGTSLKEAIQIQKQAKKAKQAAEEKAQRDAEIAEQKRIEQKAAAEKAQREAERIAQEKRKAEEKAQREAERIAQEKRKAEEKAQREADRIAKEKREAEEKRLAKEKKAKEKAEREKQRKLEKRDSRAEKEKYWSRRFHPFVAVGAVAVGMDEIEYTYNPGINFGGNTTNDGVDTALNLQLGVVFRPIKSNWEFGLRAGQYSLEGETHDRSIIYVTDFSIAVTNFYVDATIGYEIFNNFNIYAGAGIIIQEMRRETTYLLPPYYTSNDTNITKTENSDFHALIGAEYWMWNRFGIYTEVSACDFDETFQLGVKFRF